MNTKKGDILKSRIDFVCLVSVKDAMPNGDPNYANGQPRTDSRRCGLISQECIKSKIRKVARFLGENILYQPEADSSDGYTCIKDRLLSCASVNEIVKDKKIRALTQRYHWSAKTGMISGYSAVQSRFRERGLLASLAR